MLVDPNLSAIDEDVVRSANWDLETAAKIELVLIDNALVGSDDGASFSLIAAQVRVGIRTICGKAEWCAGVNLAAMRTHPGRAIHLSSSSLIFEKSYSNTRRREQARGHRASRMGLLRLTGCHGRSLGLHYICGGACSRSQQQVLRCAQDDNFFFERKFSGRELEVLDG